VRVVTLEIDELNRRGAIAAAASLAPGVLVSVGGVLVPADAVAQARQDAPASKDRVETPMTRRRSRQPKT